MNLRLGRPVATFSAAALSAVLMTACGGSDAPTVSKPAASQPQAPSPTTPSETTPSETTPSETPSQMPSETPSETPSQTASPTPTDSPKTAAPTNKNAVVAGSKAFQITPPQGWKDVSSKFKDTKIIELAIVDPKAEQGIATNVNVGVLDNKVDPQLAASANLKTLGKSADTKKELPARTMAGEKAYGYILTKKSTKSAATQYYLSHQGKLYVVTLTSSVAKGPLAKANKSLDQVVSSWSWK